MYVQPIFIHVFILNKQIMTFENISPHGREIFDSGDGNCFYRAVALRKDEMSGEKHEEIPKSSDSSFLNNPKVFELQLFSSTSLDDLVRKSKITGTLNIYSVLHRFLIKQLVCTYSLSQKEGFSFESIINAGSFLLITTKKQGICGCLITSMYHDSI